MPPMDFDDNLVNACLLENDFGKLPCPNCAKGPERPERWLAEEYLCITCDTTFARNKFAASDLKRH